MSTFADYVKNSPAPAPPPQGFFSKNIINPIKNAFMGGVNEAATGFGQGMNASNELVTGGISNLPKATMDLVGGAAHTITGVGAALASPLAPITQPTIGAGVNVASEAISNNPNVQNFANSPAGKITSNIAGAVNTGANLLGTVAGAKGTIDTIGNIWNKAYGLPEDITASRTADATPSYNKNLIGKNVMTPEGEIAPAVNEGEGLFGKRTVTTSASNSDSGAELSGLQDYPDNGTTLEKSQAVGRAIGTEAENMRGGLQAEDQASPLNAPAEQARLKTTIESNMPPNIQDAIANGKPFPKNAEGSYWKQVIDEANQYDGTREGKLNFRQAVDNAYENARGKLAWGSDSQNALDETNTSIRDSLNKDLADTTKNTDTQASLEKQTNLYRAKDVLEAKAKSEAPSQIGRFFQQHPILHRLATREFMRTATSLITAGAGITILTKLVTDTLKGK